MNHDVAHCGDYDPNVCPAKCYRAQVTADLYAREDMVGVIVSFIDFRTNGDPECPLAPSYTPAKPQSWGEVLRGMSNQQRKEAARMATREELFEAVRLISNHCALQGDDCSDCPLLDWCERTADFGLSTVPDEWPDPEEGGGEDG